MYPKKIDIKASGMSSIELPASLAYKKLDGLFERLHNAGKDSAQMRINILLYSNLIPRDSVWIYIKLTIPVIVLPTVHLEHLKITNLTSSGATLNISMKVVNKNTMRFAFHDSKYKIIFENHRRSDSPNH